MGFFNKLDDETRRLLSQTDDFVNDEIPGGWYTVAALVGANTYGMPTGGTEGAGGASGAGGFSFLPSGEMTVFSPETAGASSGGTNFLSSLFSGSSELAPLNTTDYSRSVEMYPTSSGNIFEPAGMSPSQISSIQGMGDMSLLQERMAGKSMPNFGGSSQQQAVQQMAELNQSEVSGGMRKGQAVPQAILASLLDPSVALKAYRPTLI
jgi:hypothetical protein